MPNHQSTYVGYLAECVFVSMLAIIDKCFVLQNSISYFASLVHMDYECLTYFSPVVITYAMYVLCTFLYVHIC